MSQLEVVAGPALRTLLTGARRLDELTAHERYVVSRWAVKTALALNLASDFKHMGSPALRKAFAAQPLTIPDGLLVLAAQHSPTEVVSWLQTGSVDFALPRDLGPDKETRRRLSDEAFRIGLQIAELCVVVVYWPHAQWPLAIWPELHHVLWQGSTEIVFFEHRYDGEAAPLDVDSRLFLYRAMDTVRAFELNPSRSSPVILADRKNRAPHVSGPEPSGSGKVLPIPQIVTPDDDRRIREWLQSRHSKEQR